MNAESAPRAQWATQSGFVLAALGAAIGLGNIWRFSFVAGENGGAAFILVYVGAIVLIGLPLILAELALGRATQREAVSAFSAMGRGGLWRMAGLPGVAVSFAILTYYAVISGWALKYFADFALMRNPAEAGAALPHFERFTASAIEPVVWQAAIFVITVAIVTGGIERGIERANKLLMPLLGVIVLALALHSLTLPGAGGGLAFMFVPDWTRLAEPGVYLAAVGQAFFSLGLAMGVLVTYGSYLPRQSNLPRAAVTIACGDTLIAILGGIVIFPAVFSFGISPSQGPGLAFVSLPEIFVRMTGGQTVGTAFFGLLVVAALTSMVALLEIPVAYAIERWRMPRFRAVLAVAGAGFLLGVPSSLGFGVWSQLRIFGMPVLDAVDYLASNVMLPLSGLAIALYIGWHWRDADAVAASGLRSAPVARLWRLSLRYGAPLMILIVLARALGAV